MLEISNCKICNKTIKGPLGLSKHLSNSHREVGLLDYIVKYYYQNNWPLCKCGCGAKVSFKKGGYFDFVSFSKGHQDSDLKKKIKEAREKTCLTKYGSTSSLSSAVVRQKAKASLLELYGVEHYSKTQSFKDKIKATQRERYGKEWYTQTEEYKKQFKKHNLLSWDTILEYCKEKDYTPLFTKEEYERKQTQVSF